MSEMPKEIWAGHKIGPRWSDTEDYWDYQGCTRYLRADEVEGLLREAAEVLDMFASPDEYAIDPKDAAGMRDTIRQLPE